MAVLSVIAIVPAKEGSENEVRSVLESLVVPTRHEAGCVSYDLHESVTVPGTFVTIEQWRSTEDLEEHMKTEHMLQAATAAADHLEGTPVHIHALKPVVVG